jgi:hypothetical protein
MVPKTFIKVINDAQILHYLKTSKICVYHLIEIIIYKTKVLQKII